MTNLIDRLRNPERSDTYKSRNWEAMSEAADEIEQLRSFRQAVLDPENQPSQHGTVLLAEYERLQEELQTHLQVHLGVVADNQRLRKILRRIAADHGASDHACSRRSIANDALSDTPAAEPKPDEEFLRLWQSLCNDINAEPCSWRGLRNEMRDWLRIKGRGFDQQSAEWHCLCGEPLANAKEDCPKCLPSTVRT